MVTELERIEKRTIQYWFEDGIFEISLGVFLLLLALVFLGFTLAPRGSTLNFVLGVGFLPAFLLGAWIMKKLTRYLKEKLTYPRTGYVSYRKQPAGKRRARAVIVGGMAAMLASLSALVFSHRYGGFAIFPVVSGLAFGLALGFIALRSGLARVAGVAVLSALAGVLLGLAGWPEMKALTVFYAVLAVALIVSGLAGCRLYLRRNPIPEKRPQ